MNVERRLAPIVILVSALAVSVGCNPSPQQANPPSAAPPPAAAKVAAAPAPLAEPSEAQATATSAPSAASSAGSATSLGSGLSETEARRIAAQVYGLLTDAEVDVLSVEDLGHTYKVIFRLKGREGTPDQTAYLTKDGRYITDQLLEVSSYSERLKREKRFAECLADKGLRAFVAPGDAASQQVIDAIGAYAHRVAVDCRQNPTGCQNLGISTLPTIQMGEIKEPSAKPRPWIESLSGCKY